MYTRVWGAILSACSLGLVSADFERCFRVEGTSKPVSLEVMGTRRSFDLGLGLCPFEGAGNRLALRFPAPACQKAMCKNL